MAMTRPSRQPDALRAISIEKTSTTQQIADALRLAILSGSLAPGTALREVSLAEQLAVSRNTVWEAIRLLQAEGLVRHHLNRGAVVAKLQGEDIQDIYAARTTVEVAAVAPAMGNAPLLHRLQDELAAMEAAARAGDHQEASERDRRFHATLVSALGSSRLAAFHEGLQRELRLGLLLYDLASEDLLAGAREHRRILRALTMATKDRTEAEAEVRQHLHDAAAKLYQGERHADRP